METTTTKIEIVFLAAGEEGVSVQTFTVCNFRRYGFSLQEGPADIQSTQGTSQRAFAAYGHVATFDHIVAAWSNLVMQIAIRYPDAIGVLKGQEFKSAAAALLNSTLEHHGVAGKFPIQPYQVFGEYRPTGR